METADRMPRVALVTGGSSGIGASTARRLAAAGFRTYAAARRLDRLDELAQEGIRGVALDLTDEASIEHCLASIRAESGEVDVLVNNAGYGSYGSVEEVPLEEAKRQFDVNLFGLAAITRRVIPHMRAQRRGRIVNVSSIGGVAATPYSGWYAATKFALEGFSASLRQELAPFGVHVIIVRPGATRTEWAGHATDSLLAVSGSGPYGPAARALAAAFDRVFASSTLTAEPDVLARVIVRGVLAETPKAIYVAPRSAAIQPLLRRLLPDRAMDVVFRLAMGLPKRL